MQNLCFASHHQLVLVRRTVTPPSLVKPGTVLVVEDDPDALAILCDRLRWEGYEVTCTSSGTEAWKLLEGGFRPAVMILDIMLPGIDGVALRKLMLRTRSTGEIPVIVTTAMSGMTQAVVPGVAGYFTKPVPLDELVECVARHTTPIKP